ncbi:nidogen-1 [Rhincodon typus]|uniref:nidogen-1 n=1 Tax=Rhincodon typus TaxID=259920 RepID=UPI00203001CC|nr:nidogen-1 [Rhincodon typus]
MLRMGSVWLLALLLQAAAVSGLSLGELYPHGEGAGDKLLTPGDDVTSESVSLAQTLHLFDRTVKNLYVNTNGIITISKPPREVNYVDTFPLRFGAIAAFLADLDTSDEVGKIYYRQDSSPQILHRAALMINKGFTELNFKPGNVFIATWTNVTAHEELRRGDQPQNKKNTFQVILASDESSSYAILLYPEDGLQFYGTRSKSANNIDLELPARVGFSRGESSFVLFTLEGPSYAVTSSSEQSVKNLYQDSNAGEQGVWIFHLGSSSNQTVFPASVSKLHTDYVRNSFSTVPTIDRQRNSNVDITENGSDPEYNRSEEEERIGIPEDAGVYKVASERNVEEPHYVEQFPVRTHIKVKPIQFQHSQFPQRRVELSETELDVTGNVFSYNTERQLTCANSRHVCSIHGQCRDYEAGFCCHCNPGYYGNGKQCVAEGSPQRVNGKVNANIFVGTNPVPIQFENIDLHSYVVVNDGRSYTAISRIPTTLGWSLLPLSSVGSIIGWMFALEQPGYENGFSIVGGEFSRQAEVTFAPGNEKLTINQRFSGIDEHNHLTITTSLEGRVPEIPQGSTVHIEPYNELYHYSSSADSSSVNQNPCYTGTHRCDTNAACRPEQGNRFTCECSAGFYGDGQTCYDVDECRDDPSICGNYAVCNNQPGTYRCECFTGYQFADDGRTCVAVQRPDNPCQTETHNCDSPDRARCIYAGGSDFMCVCLPGFSGDGKSCVDIDECQPNRCHPYAQCYNTPGSFTCRCSPGYQGDGFQCTPVGSGKTQCELHRDSFQSNLQPRRPRPAGFYIPECDVHGNYLPVQCLSNQESCWCVDTNGNEIAGTMTSHGVRPPCLETVTPTVIVGPTPRPDVIPLPPGTHLLYAQSGKIDHIPVEGSSLKKNEAKTLLHIPDKVVIGVAYDCVEKMVYWTDIAGRTINRASLHGGEPSTIIGIDLESPEGIAVDHLGRNIFWTDSGLDRIEVARMDGDQRRVLFTDDLVNPRAIVADPVHGNLYWTDWNRAAPKIETSYMDGTNRRILVKDDLGLPNGLTYDPYSALLCWADAGTQRLECMNPNRTGRKRILDGIHYPFGITSYGRSLYYTDWKRESVIAVDRIFGRESDEQQPSKQSRLYGITTAYSQCPPGQNHCAVNNGGCTHLCLATPLSRSCRCPDASVGVSCVERN